MLLALGDSIFRGYLVGGNSLISFIEKSGYEVLNLSSNGLNSEELLNQVKNLNKLEKFDNIIIHIGINDFLQGVSVRSVEKNIKNIIELLKKKNLIFIIPFLISTKSVDNMWANSVIFSSTINKTMEYRDFLRNLCEENKIKCISFYDYLLGKDYQSNLIDGIHPDESLHKILSEFVIEKLVEYEVF